MAGAKHGRAGRKSQPSSNLSLNHDLDTVSDLDTHADAYTDEHAQTLIG